MAAGIKILLTWAWFAYATLVVCVEGEIGKDAFRKKVADEMMSYMDTAADPCEDIYQYACGNYENIHPIPADKANFRPFDDMLDIVDIAIRNLLESVPESSVEDLDIPPQLKAKRLYDSCINRELIDSRGTQPILELLEQLGGWPLLDDQWSHTKMDAEEFFSRSNPFYSGNLIAAEITPDIEDPAQHVVAITLEELKPMTKADLKLGYNSTTTKAYQYLITETLKLFGISSDLASGYASEFIDFEMKLLEIQPEYRGVPYSTLYKKMRLGEFAERVPHFQWKLFISKSINQTLDDDYVVAVITPEYFEKLFPLLRETNPKLLANWVMLKIVLGLNSYLDQRFLDVQTEMVKMATGISKPDLPWKDCVGKVKKYFKNVLGAMYVEKYFSQESREEVLGMAENIRHEMRRLIEEKEWLQERTKKLALEKLDAIEFFIGYDEKTFSREAIEKEYKDYDIDRRKYFENILNSKKQLLKESLQKFGKPVVNKPDTSVLEVNAGYNVANNKVEVLAAFLQPTNYHKYYPRALIYGTLGSFIGHEIGHAFDRDGRQFDKTGAILNWWDDASIAAYSEKGECFADYYSQFDLFGHKLNGTISLGETMSDNTGLRAAYFAYKKWWEEHKDTDLAKDESLPGLDNFNNFDLFFLKYAQGFCENIRPEVAHIYVQGSHPPGPVRVRGTFGNNLIFAERFGCGAHGSCLVW